MPLLDREKAGFAACTPWGMCQAPGVMASVFRLPSLPPHSSHESGVHRIRRARDFVTTARTLAELAYETALGGDDAGARALAFDAANLAVALDPRSLGTGPTFAAVGHAMLAVSEVHRARDAFEDAVAAFDAAWDRSAAAHARLGLAEAMLRLQDPAARVVLEDAGSLFEEIGDAKMVDAVDRALRDAEARFYDSPRSFAATTVASRLRR